MTYHLIQSVAYMALAAGGVSDINDTPENLSSYLLAYLNGGPDPNGKIYGGFFPSYNMMLTGKDWVPVWGPVVSVVPARSTSPEDKPGYAANSMYVAHSPALRTYVVAVAGTDFMSVYDVQDEDEHVTEAEMRPWPMSSSVEVATNTSDPPPKISGGTYDGVTILQGMSYTDPSTNQPASLSDYLSSIESKIAADNEKATLIFTGHSLGGALAPTLALALYPDPKSSKWKDIHVLALAGPTAGNKAFAGLFNTAFPKKKTGSDVYPSWNTNYQNVRDAVPRAWSRLDSIQPKKAGQKHYRTLWGLATLGADVYISDALATFQGLVKDTSYKDINRHVFGSDETWGYFYPGPMFPKSKGEWGPLWRTLAKRGALNPIGTAKTVNHLIRASHVDQYYRFFKITPLQPLAKSTTQLAADRNAELKARLRLAAIGFKLDCKELEADYDPASEIDGEYDGEYDEVTPPGVGDDAEGG